MRTRKVIGPSFESRIKKKKKKDAISNEIDGERLVKSSTPIVRMLCLNLFVEAERGKKRAEWSFFFIYFVSVCKSDTHCCQAGNEVLSISLPQAPLGSRSKVRNLDLNDRQGLFLPPLSFLPFPPVHSISLETRVVLFL